jgi:hypothetical protein
VLVATTARAQGHSHGSAHGLAHHGTGGAVSIPGLAAVSGAGFSYAYGFPYYGSFAYPGVPFAYIPTVLVAPMFGPAPVLGGGGPVAGPMPPPGLFAGPVAGMPQFAAVDAAKPKKPDPRRAAQYLTFGDRNFRAGNLHRAAERYTQAIAADPGAATARIRMAQVSVNRGQYREAAGRYHEATATEPNWLVHAPDVQALYGEPTEFARQIARLETHLQADPHDRDAWLVLGAQYFLSGQTRKAADVFVRLTDRKPDATLAAFLDAAAANRPAPR